MHLALYILERNVHLLEKPWRECHLEEGLQFHMIQCYCEAVFSTAYAAIFLSIYMYVHVGRAVAHSPSGIVHISHNVPISYQSVISLDGTRNDLRSFLAIVKHFRHELHLW